MALVDDRHGEAMVQALVEEPLDLLRLSLDERRVVNPVPMARAGPFRPVIFFGRARIYNPGRAHLRQIA